MFLRQDRDKFVNRELRKLGWSVVRVWEHELKEPRKVAVKVKRCYSTNNRLSPN